VVLKFSFHINKYQVKDILRGIITLG
jgi:hypothetical protein